MESVLVSAAGLQKRLAYPIVENSLSAHTAFPHGRESTAAFSRNWLGASLVMRASRYNNDAFK